jgi:D-alanyl-D-alanine-carboxypeptidase/D-alanyl-D-alanine-endopeptidase
MQILSLLLSIPLLIAPAGEKESSVAPSTVQSLADAFVESELAPGIAIGVLDESGRIRTYCAGTLKVGGEQPVTEDTIFEIGSITKVFTATLAHLLEQRGELSLSDPVGVHLPDEIDVKVVDGNEMMLWHLATHTSGLPKMPNNFKPKDPRNPYADYTNAQLYEFLQNTGPQRAPGQESVYSNVGIGLLGHILELNQDASYEELVQQHILKPLKMSRTRCTPRDSDVIRVATAHSGLQPASAWDINGPMAGAGDLNSSLRDMMKFARANLSDSNTQLHRSLRACQVPRVGKSRARVGLAWHVSGESSERIIHHGGATGGFRSFMAFMPDRGRAVVVLANSTHDVGTLGRHILAPDIVGIEQLPLLVAIPTYQPRQPINHDEYVGSYRSDSDARFVVENRNGELFARLDKQNFFAFRPIGEDLFLFDRVNARLRFEHDAQGRVTTLILKQNGRETRYIREF